MAKEFRLEDPGEGIHEAEIIEVHVSEGDTVDDGDTVLTVETDKASVEIPAPFSGVVKELRVAEGDIAKVGDVLMTYSEEGSESRKSEDESEEAEAGDSDSEDADSDDEDDRGGDDNTAANAKDPDIEESDTKDGDAEDDDAEDEGAEDEDAEDEDPEADRKRESDTSSREEGDGDEREAEEKSDSKRAQEGPVPAAPATRRLARELGVELGDVEPGGPHGRVTPDDVRAAAESEESEADRARDEDPDAGDEKPESETDDERQDTDADEIPDFERWGEIERQPLRSIRRATARRMARAWAEIPHVMHQEMADITELEDFRQKHAEAVEAEGGSLTLTILAIKAAVAALKAHPRFNASLDTRKDEIVLKRYYNIGVAVDTDQGLYVPVIQNADAKSLLELSRELKDLAERARAGKLKPDDMRGGTFTITNPGPLGGYAFAPIINHPEAAILGLAQASLQPVVTGDREDPRITARLILPVCMAFDHRINDGADAARFAQTLVETLTDVSSLVLHI